jgi:AraC family ethanolamine operon transcriptional activator
MHQPAAGGGAALASPGEPRRIRDFDHLVLLFAAWHGRFEQLSRGRFEGTVRVARGRHARAFRATTNQALRAKGRESVGVMSICLVTPRGARCVWQGRHLDPGRVVVLGGDAEADHQTSKDAVSFQFLIGEDRFRRAVVDQTGDDPGPMGWRPVLPAPGAYARLEAAMGRFLDDPSAPTAGGEDAESACVAAAVAALFPPAGRSPHGGLPLAARSVLVRRAEAAMRDRLRAAVGEADLCRELGVRGRTLRLAFRERFGMGPMAYYQSLRLNAVRAALKDGGGEVPVAGVARAFGFHHPGKFAGYYRRLFGEVPSETIARRPR